MINFFFYFQIEIWPEIALNLRGFEILSECLFINLWLFVQKKKSEEKPFRRINLCIIHGL